MAQHSPTTSISLSDLHLTLFFGGPSNERNISLDSARTFYDSVRHLLKESHISLVFIDPKLQFHLLDAQWIYSNTIEDFEHQLTEPMEKSALEQLVRQSHVLAPMVHGAFGEDGQLTQMLSDLGRKAIIGSPHQGLALTLDKFRTTEHLKAEGYPTVENLLVTKQEWQQHPNQIVKTIQAQIPHDLNGRFIVKPNNCGSSDGVTLCGTEELSAAMAKALVHTDQVLIEKRIIGREFSLIVLENEQNQPISLLPTEVRLQEKVLSADNDIYSRSKKYLPGAGAIHLTPMLVDAEMIDLIRSQASALFQSLQLSDWARFDGFLTESGDIYWSDLNGIPGSGLDSFLFQQAALFGLDHRGVFLNLLAQALKREHRLLEYASQESALTAELAVAVIGGGSSSERHVSRMSWFNVTQKLKTHNHYQITSVFLDRNDQFWEVPSFVALQHTVEEIEEILQDPSHYAHGIQLASNYAVGAFERFAKPVEAMNFLPRKVTLKQLSQTCQFAFLALHGGRGENGQLQRELESLGMAFNGSDSETAPVCMDKVTANQRCQSLNIPGFHAPHQRHVSLEKLQEILQELSGTDLITPLVAAIQNGQLPWENELLPEFESFSKAVDLWISKKMAELCSPNAIVLKPRGDGCSSGVLVSRDPSYQVPRYLLFCFAKISDVPYQWLYPNLEDSSMLLQMPPEGMRELLLEQFLGDIPGEKTFMEMTVGVVGPSGAMTSLYPSETLAVGDVLSLDEKFNKGMGVNLTPPPSLSASQVSSIQNRVAQFANAFGLRNYARIDIMYHIPSDTVYLIEINTLPGLTAATILYTQALVTPEFSLKPGDFLDFLIQNAMGHAPQSA